MKTTRADERPSRVARRGRRTFVALGLVAGLAAGAVGGADAASPPATDADNAKPGDHGWFEAGLDWRGDFPDPTIVRWNGTYYAYSAGAGGRYLGVTTSKYLKRWKARPRYTTNAPPWLGGPNPSTDSSIPIEIRESPLSAGDKYNLNDALVRPARWGQRVVFNDWLRKSYWAVGVARIGETWFAYASTKVSDRLADGTADPDGLGRYCLSLATGPGPMGPFRDVTGTTPLYCDPDPAGSIDPQPYRDPATDRTWLTWKATGRRSRPGVQGYPSALKAARLNAEGRIVKPIITLLTTNEGSWEGMTIENPSMIKWRGQWYLFYSGNSFRADAYGRSPYATGYAMCAGPGGPCRRVQSKPLMASKGDDQGPGGATAFTDGDGRLHLAYASYWLGENRPYGVAQPRRLRIVQVVRNPNGTLSTLR